MGNIKKGNKKIKDIEKQYKKLASKKILIFCILSAILLLALTGRTAWIVFVKGASYKEAAYNQQTSSKVISPKRGTIYDSTGKIVLATSASVETVTINPVNIEKEKKEDLINAFCNIFDLEYEKVAKKLIKEAQ